MIGLTVEESNLMAIYMAGTRNGTLANLQEALSFIDDPDMLTLADVVITKLNDTTDMEFDSLTIELIPPVPYADDVHDEEKE